MVRAHIQFRRCSPALAFPLRPAVPSPEVPSMGRLFHGALQHSHCMAETSGCQGQVDVQLWRRATLQVTSPPGLRSCCLCTRYSDVHLHEGELADRDRHQAICLIVRTSLMSLSFWVPSQAHDCIKGWWGERQGQQHGHLPDLC